MKTKQKKNKTNIFTRAFKGFINIIDKIIITPFSKLAYTITDKLNIKSGTFEKFLNRPNTLLYLSLILAFTTFVLIDNRVINLISSESIVLENQIVDVEYNDEAYVVEGLPEDVDIVLMGRKMDLYLAEQLGEHKLTLDLSDYAVGTHKVNIKYNNPVNNLDYIINPSEVTVVIYPKVSEVRTLSIDVLNTDKLNETLVVSNVLLDRDEVIIKSHEAKLSQVASVKALIDVNALNAIQAGTYTLENVKLVAYDEEGTELTDIEIIPETVTATVTITSPSKVVPIQIVPVGEVAPGSAIESIESSVSQVTVYADEEILESLNYIEVEIDVTGLNEDKVFQKVITKPNGARSISETSITINVTMEAETSKEFVDIPIVFENLANGLKVNAQSEEDTKVTVSVGGVESLLEKLEASDIKAYVDLQGLGVGTHTVPVYVTGEDLKLTYTSKTQNIRIIIE